MIPGGSPPGEVPLARSVGAQLAARGETVACAESCTGGLVAEQLTSVAGSSAWMQGGVVAYANEVKRELLGVPGRLLLAHGAVSEPVARAMAEGARDRLGATWALSTTGIAGPGGGTPDKPVGTVWIALAGPHGTEARLLHLSGDRTQIRLLTAARALELLDEAARQSPAAPAPAPAPDSRLALLLFCFTLFAYALSSGGMLWRTSHAPQFIWQAEAYLHGQLQLVTPPPNLNDWVRLGDGWAVSFPPFPAIVMLPFVALLGRAVPDAAVTVCFGALNVALLFLLLRRLSALGEEGSPGGNPGRSRWEHAALALVFGFSTLAWSCAIRGEVWFTAETIGVTLTLCYLSSGLHATHPCLAGIFLGCAALTRTPLLFSAPFFLLEALLSPADGALPPRASAASVAAALRDPAQRRLAASRLLRFALPALAVGLPAAWANLVRFGSPFEFGHSHLFANRVNEQVARYGLFHWAFLERNLHAAFTRLPTLELRPLRLGYDAHGMSLFVTTPLLALLPWPARTPRLHRLLWITVACVALPGLLYQNDGWQQFGFRFSLDYTPHLVALLALGGRRMGPGFLALAALGAAVNGWGAAVFNRW